MNKLGITALTICVLLSTKTYSQNMLYQKGGVVVAIKDLKVTQKSISFKLFADPDQYTHHISTSVVDSIVFENGTITRFSEDTNQNDKNKFTGLDYSKSNTVFVDLYYFSAFNNICIGYEHMFAKQNIGLTLTYFKGYTIHREEKKSGITTACNFYVKNTGNFNYGARFLLQSYKYYMDLTPTTTKSKIYYGYGCGVFFKLHIEHFISPIFGFDLLLNKDRYINDKNLELQPQIALGLNF